MNVKLVDMATLDGRIVKDTISTAIRGRISRGEMVEVVATPKPDMAPVISQEVTQPGQPPVPPDPVPDCSQWRYFVERWVLESMEDHSYSIPVLNGYDRITYTFGEYSTYIDVPRFVNVPIVKIKFIYEWVAIEYNGCGVELSTHRSGVKTETFISYTDQNLANALLASDSQQRQLEAWNKSLLNRANAAGQQAIQGSVSTDVIYSGAYATAEAGLHATQLQIESAMRDYAESMDVYNAALDQHQMDVAKYEQYQDAVAKYEEQVELTSNMIREDKVGTAYTVKGAGNKTISLTVGQEITGAQLISSGIQSIGSGHNIDPHTTYIIADVDLTYSAPRVNVPGLWGTSFPGRITITK